MAELLSAFGLIGEETPPNNNHHVFKPAKHRVGISESQRLNDALMSLAKWSAEGEQALSQREMRELNDTLLVNKEVFIYK